MISVYYVLIILILETSSEGIHKFICEDGSEIELAQTCDGIKHCRDGTDEVMNLCFHIICPENTFRCHYGACIHKESRCDGRRQCADGSDENQCSKVIHGCKSHQFKCLSGECILDEKLCDGKKDCQDNSDEDKNVCSDMVCPVNAFHCKYGGCIHLNQRCNGYKDCVDGSDESQILCKSLNCSGKSCDEIQESINCPPVTSSRIVAICEVPAGKKKGRVPCNQPLPVGTIVRYNCKRYYIPANKKHASNTKMLCQSDGTWNREILTCKPDCGHVGEEIGPLILKGWAVENQAFPWHATLYALMSGNWSFICGGSLISEKVVITAAHCTWDATKQTLRVALGKYNNDYFTRQTFTQIKSIEKIILHPLYQDSVGNFGSDIAIIVLSETVKFSSSIRPVCIDWRLKNNPNDVAPNKLGLILGMGLTENDTFSVRLRASYIPVISEKECIQQLKRDFKKYVTFTSFCGGWKNGSGACNGDSGGGLVFPPSTTSNKWTLQGIVSISPRRLGTSFCDPKAYTIFTKVEMYVQWIYNVLRSIHLSEMHYPFIEHHEIH